MRPYRVLTWHVHGGYLESLARTGVEWYLPTRPGGDHGYTGKPPALAEFDNVHDVPVEAVPGLDLDAIVFQNQRNYLEDQHEILTAAQRRLPRLYVEHDPPRANVTDSRHVVDDPDVLLVHVTAFNRLMWDSGATPTVVIDHGMADPGVSWTGELERGVVVINDIATRGRRLGLDLFLEARGLLPLDLVGLRSGAVGGLGEVDHRRLPAFMAGYRFFFHPARYTSLGLAVIEAMLVGLPVVALATTEMPTVLEDGVSGIVSTEPERLYAGMAELLRDRRLAARLGQAGREVALARFGIDRFARDWQAALDLATGHRAAPFVEAVAGMQPAAGVEAATGTAVGRS